MPSYIENCLTDEPDLKSRIAEGRELFSEVFNSDPFRIVDFKPDYLFPKMDHDEMNILLSRLVFW